MIVPGSANPLLLGDAGYNIQRSLRFRSSASAYLSRTQTSSVTNNNKWTFSGWVKRGTLGTTTSLLSSYSGTGASQIYFDANDKLRIFIPDNGGVTKLDYVTTQVFRDPSAFYHIVISLDNTLVTSVLSLYVNGTSVTSFSTSTNSLVQNGNYQINKASTPMLVGEIYNNGAAGTLASGYYFDGILAEVNFIDGQALTPSSFGETDTATGVWKPKKYGGSYGTNGFYLPFSDNTSATTLAYDKSGNSNNWTANNISTTAGATYDSMTDVPTLTSATAANYCTWNPLYYWHDTYFDPCTLTNGNLTASDSGKPWNTIAYGTFGMASGKWYWEITNTTLSDWHKLGIIAADYTQSAPFDNSYTYVSNATKWVLASNTAYGATFATGDIIGLAFDADTGTLTCYKNGVSQGTLSSAIPMTKAYVPYYQSNDGGTNVVDANFGQRLFSYTPPTGFKALNTFNLPDPTIKKPNQYMDATLYTGNGTTNAITNAGSFQPDLVWMKNRASAYYHGLYDSVRGTGTSKSLYSNTTEAEGTNSTNQNLVSFNSNGFTLGATSSTNAINTNGQNHVGWQWKKGATPGFDIVTYTGTGSPQTVNHSLGVAPKMIIVKSRSNGTYGWSVYHASVGAGSYLILNQTDAASASSTIWNNTAPTSTNFSVGNNVWTSGNTYTYVAYLFSEIPGFSKFGSYTGNGSNDGPFIYLGCRARWVLFKCITTGSHWVVCDTARDPINAVGAELAPNNSNAENGTVSGGNDYDIVSNGIKMRYVVGNEYNVSGYQYIYAAFAENPFKYSLAR